MLSDFDYAELLKYKTPHAPKADERERLDTLIHRGLVRIYDFEQVDIGPYGKVPAPNRYVLTVAGQDALAEFDKNNHQPNKGHDTEHTERPGKQFYKSPVFWAAAAVIISTILWAVDRFILSV